MTARRIVYQFGVPNKTLLIFGEQFTGTGAQTQFQLTGTIINGTFEVGEFNADQVKTTLPVEVTGTDYKPTYDSIIPVLRHVVAATGVTVGGLVTLDYPPRNGVSFYIWYWYDLESEDLVDEYWRNDFVASMEQASGAHGSTSLYDTDSSNILSLFWNENDTADRALDIYVGGANRTICLATDGYRAYSSAGLKLWADDGTSLGLHISDAGYVGLAGLWDNTSGQDVSTSLVSLLRTTPLNTWTDRSGLFKSLDWLRLTANPSTNYNSNQFHGYYSVATGITVSRILHLTQYYALRNFDTASTDDSGTHSSTLNAQSSSYGHYDTNTNAVPITTTVNGFNITPYARRGSITTLNDIKILAVNITGNPGVPVVTAHYPINQEQGDNITGSAAGVSRNYFNARTGFKTTDPQGVVEIEDGGTAYTQLLKITQDDANVYGLIIGNDTYSTTDTLGLCLWVGNTGSAVVENSGALDLYLRAIGTANASDVFLEAEDHIYMRDYNAGSQSYWHYFNMQTGNVGIGASTTANYRLVVDNTIAVSAVAKNLYLNQTLTQAASANIALYGTHSTFAYLLASGQTNTSSIYGTYSTVLRNASGASVDDSGTLTTLTGLMLYFGHDNNDAAETPITTSVYGIRLNPYYQTGTVGTIYGIYIDAAATGGTLTGNQWGLYASSTSTTHYVAGTFLAPGLCIPSVQGEAMAPIIGGGHTNWLFYGYKAGLLTSNHSSSGVTVGSPDNVLQVTLDTTWFAEFRTYTTVTPTAGGTATWEWTWTTGPNVASAAQYTPYIIQRAAANWNYVSNLKCELKGNDDAWVTVYDTAPVAVGVVWRYQNYGLASYPPKGIRYTLTYNTTTVHYTSEMGLWHYNYINGTGKFASLLSANSYWSTQRINSYVGINKLPSTSYRLGIEGNSVVSASTEIYINTQTAYSVTAAGHHYHTQISGQSNIATGTTITGNWAGTNSNVRRNSLAAGTDDSGTLVGDMYGNYQLVGHTNTNVAATPVLTGNLYGFYSGLYWTTGSISGSAYAFYAAAPSVGGTLSGSQYGIYVAGTAMINHFAYRLGVGAGCTAPVGVVEIEDGVTTATYLLKITQDDANTYALMIGNDTYSTTDALGLRLSLDSSGHGHVFNAAAGDLLLTASGTANTSDIYLRSEDTIYFQDYAAGTPVTKLSLDVINAYLYLGVDDTQFGFMSLYGHTAGNTSGGRIAFYTAADHDTTISYYMIKASSDQLHIGPDTDADALVLDGSNFGIGVAPSWPLHVAATLGVAATPTYGAYLDFATPTGALTGHQQHIALGIDLDINNVQAAYVYTAVGMRLTVLAKTDSDTDFTIGQDIIVTAQDSATVHTLYGSQVSVTNNSTDGASGVLRGLFFDAISSQDVTSVHGIYGLAETTGGSVTTLTGAEIYANHGPATAKTCTTATGALLTVWSASADATITTAYGLKIDVNELAGTITTGYLIYGAMTGTLGTEWGIYLTGETKNYLSGQLGIGMAPVADLLQVGNGTNYSTFEADGTLRFAGTATVFKDINQAAVALGQPASGAPGDDKFLDEVGGDTGIYTKAYAVDEYSCGVFEMQHDYKEGSDITFHVHWQGIAAPSGTDNVAWELTYTIARNDNTVNAVTTITTADKAFDTRYESVRSDFSAIVGSTGGVDGGNIKIGDQFNFKLKRVLAAGDAYAGDALMHTCGIHYECDTLGSRTITAK